MIPFLYLKITNLSFMAGRLHKFNLEAAEHI